MNRPSRHQLALAVVSLVPRDVNNGELAKSLAAYLISERRVKELDSLMRDVMELRKQNGVNEVTTTSVHALSEDIKQQLQQLLANNDDGSNKVVINEVLTQSVVGGLRVESATEQLDLTIRGRLDHFKQLVTGKESA